MPLAVISDVFCRQAGDSSTNSVPSLTQNVSGGEAMLDLDIAYSIIYPQKINYIMVDDEFYETVYCAERRTMGQKPT